MLDRHRGFVWFGVMSMLHLVGWAWVGWGGGDGHLLDGSEGVGDQDVGGKFIDELQITMDEVVEVD